MMEAELLWSVFFFARARVSIEVERTEVECLS